MRLARIKLSGFKSFVDPTVFHAPTNLTGIVGPNGCGKSNIIDAVRWVMGEGSAKVLRGESMADVIFSGSSTRKPVGTATVELIFDNSDGRVAGQFAGYNEISVKRQVSRDGVSNYFLNGTRCRRKDVRDLFLGTGLGSRSYSIIEQGMISEVVEARPEEIRGHLEEAAGISKYKERRRETENRIRHTRDNLARLSDLRDEVGKHLNRLQRQAAAAKRYRKLKKEKREKESRLLALRWRALKEQADAGSTALAQRETALQQSIAGQRNAEAALEKLHQEQGQAGERFNEVQGELYSVGSEIARLEQTIQHARELQARQRADYDETGEALNDIEKHIVLDRAQVEELTRALAEVEPALKTAIEAEEEANTQLAAVEAEVQSWQETFEAHHHRNSESQRQADLKRAEINNLDERMARAARRLENLEQETETADTSDFVKALAALEEEAVKLASEQSANQKQLDELRSQLTERRDNLRATERQVQERQRELHTREGRLESLQAVQTAALAESGNDEWLQAQGLADAARLAKKLRVAGGWELAVETVLGQWLQSVLTRDDDRHISALAGLEGSLVELLDDTAGNVAPRSGTLAEHVEGAPDVVVDWLNRVRVADELVQAWKERKNLDEAESFITPRGEWLGSGWIRVARGQPGEEGMLAREKAIADLRDEVERLTAEVAKQSTAIEAERTELGRLEASIRELQESVNSAHQRRSEVESRAESRRASIAMMDKRQAAIAEEVAELREQLDADQQKIKSARSILEQHVEEMAAMKQERDGLDAQRSELMARRDASRNGVREARDRRHDLALKAESRRASLDSLQQSLERMDTQLSQLQQRYVTLSEQLARAEDPDKAHAADMDALLARRSDTEARLTAAREELQQLEEAYRERDAERQKSVQQSDEIRQQLERDRLAQQELELNARNLERQIEELDGDVEALAADLPDAAEVAEWEAELERLGERITRLEPVNLAAIDEFEEEKQRKEYLDAQNEDLCQALATLEEAIAKIDRKTRTRFKETFERVNKGVQELFPRLFGGGHAYLELTGDDLLTTGVSIMARPPGKRVSSIHLLSGGEKALTAVSFVFAIFQLNPAPFCLLDEVDAPLDDSNVARFSGMVQELSETVQFIFVTHNKITMEMAQQLAGVTMREPGVSRLVQVDIDQAAQLAAS
ncbi:chromosome segregation protein SMC [Elongatibacter sediminis]|uniref:Chromosome partition protein Smc n=1 Tax=Elongatibacter sediminis TaxID=3119006 RepID=A0AAW9RFB4_9GAMM